jgi:hypothetical protein
MVHLMSSKSLGMRIIKIDSRKLFLSLLISLNLLADNGSEDIAQKTHLANINSILIFTAQDGLTSGLYHFDHIGVQANMYSLPFSYNFKPFYKNINSFVSGTVSYSSVTKDKGVFLKDGTPIDYDNQIQTYIAGVGTGLRYRIIDKFYVIAGVEFLYSRSGISLIDENSHTAPVEDFFDSQYADNLTYKFYGELNYQKTIQKFKAHATLSYRLYETKSDFHINSLSTFRSNSSVVAMATGVESPKTFGYKEYYHTIDGYYKRYFLDGVVKDTVEVSGYNTFGIINNIYTPDDFEYIKRFYVEFSKAYGSGIQGTNIGLGFSLRF